MILKLVHPIYFKIEVLSYPEFTTDANPHPVLAIVFKIDKIFGIYVCVKREEVRCQISFYAYSVTLTRLKITIQETPVKAILVRQ